MVRIEEKSAKPGKPAPVIEPVREKSKPKKSFKNNKFASLMDASDDEE